MGVGRVDFNVKREGSWIVFSDEQREYITREYVKYKNVSIATLAKKFGVSSYPIQRVLKEENVELKNVSTYRQKYKISHNFFDEIDTEEKAYWLGFLYADGCVREDRGCFRLGLQARDVRHLEKFRESLDSNHPIKESNKVT